MGNSALVNPRCLFPSAVQAVQGRIQVATKRWFAAPIWYDQSRSSRIDCHSSIRGLLFTHSLEAARWSENITDYLVTTSSAIFLMIAKKHMSTVAQGVFHLGHASSELSSVSAVDCLHHFYNTVSTK